MNISEDTSSISLELESDEDVSDIIPSLERLHISDCEPFINKCVVVDSVSSRLNDVQCSITKTGMEITSNDSSKVEEIAMQTSKEGIMHTDSFKLNTTMNDLTNVVRTEIYSQNENLSTTLKNTNLVVEEMQENEPEHESFTSVEELKSSENMNSTSGTLEGVKANTPNILH
ncbi:hypothetical protein NPIL_284621 [Nephila pilipes]|uniref:Uncharacterized protein n=1 Tax=Nephila pilipes TaxID=299642 RepID=A0A8X6T8J5_NEPPI|nr:hypothetical protein NPIL_284621 [Nephila pilipes]